MYKFTREGHGAPDRCDKMQRQGARLVRDFISRSLYHESTGYFAQTDCVLSPAPLDFNSFTGRAAYEKQVNSIYSAKSAHAWLTPVEVFKPWYSRAIANYILSQHLPQSAGQKLRVFEFGGGNGTNADNILKFIKEWDEELYQRTKYTLVEISPAMAQRQKSLLAAGHPSSVFRVKCQDIKSWDKRVDKPCFVLGLEVLDNLPHDKLVRRTKEDMWHVYREQDQSEWFQTMVVKDGISRRLVEQLAPLEDSLALRAAKHFLTASQEKETIRDSSSLFKAFFSAMTAVQRERRNFERPLSNSDDKAVFVPSGAVQLLDVLFKFFPQHQLVLADFDTLPAPNLSFWTLWRSTKMAGRLQGCRNAPIVSGENKDYPSYLDNPGNVDIFFQTDFDRLRIAYEQIGREHGSPHAHAHVQRSKDFLIQHAEHHRTRTRGGYNPMIDDYQNTCFLLANTVADHPRTTTT